VEEVGELSPLLVRQAFAIMLLSHKARIEAALTTEWADFDRAQRVSTCHCRPCPSRAPSQGQQRSVRGTGGQVADKGAVQRVSWPGA
jgi:hypothetical protein